MTARPHIDVAVLRSLWADGHRASAIGKIMGFAPGSIRRLASIHGLLVVTPRVFKVPRAAPRAADVTKSVALADREDYRDLVAAAERAKTNITVGQVAARFRVPYEVVRELAGVK